LMQLLLKVAEDPFPCILIFLKIYLKD